jgi:hypothetical protein
MLSTLRPISPFLYRTILQLTLLNCLLSLFIGLFAAVNPPIDWGTEHVVGMYLSTTNRGARLIDLSSSILLDSCRHIGRTNEAVRIMMTLSEKY